ncbi:MAG: hypothetical protein ACJ8AW_52250 [Rhodopila sp.]
MNAPALAPEALEGIQAAQDALDRHAARLAATGDPVADTVAACAAVVKASNRLVVDAALKTQAQTGADMERAARQALTGLRPAFEQRWRWQRWAALVGAFAAGCVAMGLVGTTAWTLSAAVTRREAGAEVARWQSWWNATCADQSPRRVVLAGKPVCQVPMERGG